MSAAPSEPQIMRETLFNLAVCVPRDYTDDQVEKFAQSNAPCGTTNGWKVRKDGDERVQCAERSDCVHIILEA